jgi:hypothetical protein
VGREWEEARRRRGGGDGKVEEKEEKEEKEGAKGELLGIREPDLFILIRKIEQSFINGHDILSILVTNRLQQVEKGF